MHPRRTLIATCSAGLCNRLLVMGGSLRIARRTGRDFMLYWPENEHLGCPFHALFENPLAFLGGDHLHWLLQTERNVKLYGPHHGCGPRFSDLGADGDPEVEAVIIKAWYAPKLAGEEYTAAFHGEVREHLLALRPRPEILAEADAFKLPPRCVGVHVRRADACADAVAHFAHSQDDHFTAIMEAVIARVPNVSFFLAADNEATEKMLRARFGDRVCFYRKTSRGRDRRGVEEALVDLLLLSRTAGLVGTHWSSFSNTAALLGPQLLFVASKDTAGSGLQDTAARLAGAVAAR